MTTRAAWPVRLLAALACFLFILAALFFCIEYTINDEAFFAREYARLNQAPTMGMNTADLTAATMAMIGYMEGRNPSIDLDVTVYGQKVSMFNDQERAHMVDVRALYQGFRLFAWIATGLYVLLLVLQKALRLSASRAFVRASWAFAVVLAVLAAWILIDFNSFWTGFHLVFFSNNLWLLDPATSRMINMMPWELFYEIVLKSVLLFLGVWAALIVLAALARLVELRKKA